MTEPSDTARLLLHAELAWSAGVASGNTIELSAEHALVRNDAQLGHGEAVDLTVSCGGLFETLSIPATVEARTSSREAGRITRLCFPTSPQVAALLASSKRAESSARRGSVGVLMFEDGVLLGDIVAHAARTFFRERAVSIVLEVTGDLETALHGVCEQVHQLVIVDLDSKRTSAGRLSGVELITRIRANPRSAGTPLIAISMAGPHAGETARAAGADLYVDKPVLLDDLLGTIAFLAARVEGRPPRRSARVLVVDDSDVVLDASTSTLAAAGFEVVVAHDLQTLDDRLRDGPFDAMVMDVHMPEAFGDDVAAALSSVRQVRTPTILFSSMAREELAARADAAKVAGFVCKRDGAGALVSRIRDLLGMSTQDSASALLRERFLPRFVGAARERLTNCRALVAAAPDNSTVIQGHLHALAGEASMLGLDELSARAREGEQGVDTWDPAGGLSCLTQLEKLVAELDEDGARSHE